MCSSNWFILKLTSHRYRHQVQGTPEPSGPCPSPCGWQLFGLKDKNWFKVTQQFWQRLYIILVQNEAKPNQVISFMRSVKHQETLDGDIISHFHSPSQAFRWRSLASLSGCSAASFTVLRASTFASKSPLLERTSSSLAWQNKSKLSDLGQSDNVWKELSRIWLKSYYVCKVL